MPDRNHVANRPSSSQLLLRPSALCARALPALTVAALFSPWANAEGLRVAFIPPVDRADVLSSVQALSRTLGFEVDTLKPEELVDPAVFSTQRYHVAVYTGSERYIYEVARPGDGVQALLGYLGKGGTFLVTGLCWPFHRPFRWSAGVLSPYEALLPQYHGPHDPWLQQAMKRLSQSPVGTFNRFFGLNIAGEGTVQFEQPEEAIEFVVSEQGRKMFPSLPARFPFPGAGDLRFRPASPKNLGAGVSFTSIAEAVGASGKKYGPGICVVDHSEGSLARGRVIYIWGTLVQGQSGVGLLGDALRLAARHARLGGEAALTAAQQGQRASDALVFLAASVERVPVYPERTYFERQVANLRRSLDLAVQAAELGNVERSNALLAAARDETQLLQERLAALSRNPSQPLP